MNATPIAYIPIQIGSTITRFADQF